MLLCYIVSMIANSDRKPTFGFALIVRGTFINGRSSFVNSSFNKNDNEMSASQVVKQLRVS